MISQCMSPGGAEYKAASTDDDEKNVDGIPAESKKSEVAESKAEEKRSDRREGKEEHKHRVTEMRTDRLREVQKSYLESLREARDQYFDARQKGASNARRMFEPSPEFFDAFAADRPHPTSCRNLNRTKFWGTERGGAKDGSEGKEQEEAEELNLTEEEIEQEIDRLKTRSMEVEALLREKFDDEGCIETCRSKLEQCSEFYESLGKLASTLKVLKGAFFQELLSRGTGKPRGHINRDRVTGLVKLEEVLTDEEEMQKMILSAEALCDLVRVKIEDDNDLGLALSVVGDSLDFFTEMSKLAKIKGEEEYPFLQMLRTF